MRIHPTKSWVALCVIACPLIGQATVIYDSPGVYVIDTPLADNVEVANSAAHLIVESTVQGGVHTRVGSTEVVGHGRVQGMRLGGGRSVVWLRDQSLVQGEVVAEFSPGMDEATALMRIYLEDQAIINGNIRPSGYLRIEDQALVTGSIFNTAFGNLGIDMRGGVIGGDVQMSSLNDYAFDMSGGAILGGIRGISAYVDMNMTGGYIAGGINTGASLTGSIRGGQIGGGILIHNGPSSPSSDLDITAGRFDASADDWLLSLSNEGFFGSIPPTSSLDIWGGEFGYFEQGRGFFIDDWVDFNIWGRDLVYSNGWLSGYLQDGSWFNNQLTFGDNWQGTFTIHNVPEPGTLGMLAACLIGIAAFGRRRQMLEDCVSRAAVRSS